MEITAQSVIDQLLQQIANQAKEIAILKAQINNLLEENETLKSNERDK